MSSALGLPGEAACRHQSRTETRGGHLKTTRTRATVLAAGLLACAMPVQGQSVLDRTPNLQGVWWGTPGTVYFNFLHRFTASDPPVRQVTNNPTFLLAAGLPGGVLAGFNYATRSDIATR